MITEKHLNHILKEMDYALLSLAKETTKGIFPNVGTSNKKEFISIKYLQEKIAVQKFYVEWIHAHMEDDGA